MALLKLVIAIAGCCLFVTIALIEPAPDSDVPLLVLNDSVDGVQVANPVDGTTWRLWYRVQSVVGIKDGCVMTYWYGHVREHHLFDTTPRNIDLLLPHGAALYASATDPCQMMVSDTRDNFYMADACTDHVVGLGDDLDADLYWETSGNRAAYSCCNSVYVADVQSEQHQRISDGTIVPFNDYHNLHHAVVVETETHYEVINLATGVAAPFFEKTPTLQRLRLYDADENRVFFEVTNPFNMHTLYVHDVADQTTTAICTAHDAPNVTHTSAADGAIIFACPSDPYLNLYSVETGLQALPIAMQAPPAVADFEAGCFINSTVGVDADTVHQIQEIDLATGALSEVYCGQSVKITQITDEWLVGINADSHPFVMRRADGETFTLPLDACNMISIHLYPSMPHRSPAPMAMGGLLVLLLASAQRITTCRSRCTVEARARATDTL